MGGTPSFNWGAPSFDWGTPSMTGASCHLLVLQLLPHCHYHPHCPHHCQNVVPGPLCLGVQTHPLPPPQVGAMTHHHHHGHSHPHSLVLHGCGHGM